MQYTLVTSPLDAGSECVILGTETATLAPALRDAFAPDDRPLLERLQARLQDKGDMAVQSDFHGKCLVLVACDKASDFTLSALQKRLSEIAAFVIKQRFRSITLCLPQITDKTPNWQVEYMICLLEARFYQMLDFKQEAKVHALESVAIVLDGASSDALATGSSLASGIRLARTLANMPANICTPSYLAKEAEALAAEFSAITTKVHEKAALEAMKMGALLAVGQGSATPPVLVEMHYQGGTDGAPPVVLVGKGITFDSGGISIKPAAGMEEMKFDMSGAASVLGTLRACALLKLPINVIGLLACAENMPSGNAVKPGDVVTSSSGITIEITNTDAEGRLVLADALTYAERFKPAFVLDIATLTGAMVIALGHLTTGFMTPDDTVAGRLERAARQSGDKAWRLPMDAEYGEVMESPIADLQNAAGDRAAGSITAACFLSRFTKNYPWAHLDIAGTAWVSGKSREATGRPVSLLIEVLRDVARAG
ncbi:aminopeptidase A/I [Legionella geestiana]|uniref:Probable cytosol aminopeptidase n=1 Tax=Legionella geestiana TaxID=45065 RepID=A0A0W0TVM2_9GAMM|nr:leucyl aminopeptidase [Legionella geestiana]KTC99663.1 aminopeptidase A/I [Legionella geestiana]QBS13214.1 leucyl aminopeptidase [Legionella geestiana]STX54264.1 aminopeptidase A/I [Legionella geestiana]